VFLIFWRKKWALITKTGQESPEKQPIKPIDMHPYFHSPEETGKKAQRMKQEPKKHETPNIPYFIARELKPLYPYKEIKKNPSRSI
jgi:hypothetical protein